MKRVIVILLCLALQYIPINSASASEQSELHYAMILKGCIMYSDPYYAHPITALPATYFVTVLSRDGENLHVSYINIDGYIKAEFAEEVNFTPRYKYADYRVTLINDGGTINVRAMPDHINGEIRARLTDGTRMECYGDIQGSIQNDLIGDKWFSVKLSGGEVGYVYSMYVNAPPLRENVIEAEPSPEPTVPDTELVTSERGEYFLIAALCLPVIVFMYVLFKSKDD